MSDRSKNLHDYASRRDRLALQQTRRPPKADDEEDDPLRDFVLYIDNEYASTRVLELLRTSSLSSKCTVVKVETLGDRPSWMISIPILVDRPMLKAYTNHACELYIKSLDSGEELQKKPKTNGFKMSWSDS